jgi:catechol 2,3-dioxygenase-like lactoylglutathione lyase family enzyme
MAKPVLNQINIVAADIAKSRDFYKRLGVPIAEPADSAPEFHAGCELENGFDFDLDTPAFAQVWNSGWAGGKDLVGRVVIGFHLPTRDKIDAVYAELTDAGYKGLQPPWDAFWGARYAIVEDPNGVAVGLMSPIDQARRYWPPKNWNP